MNLSNIKKKIVNFFGQNTSNGAFPLYPSSVITIQSLSIFEMAFITF